MSDDHRHVFFNFEGARYWIYIDPNDPQFIKLVFYYFWPIESPEDRARALAAADHANRSTKAAKTALMEDGTNVSVAIDVLLEHPEEEFRPVFYRWLGTLQYAAERFREKMRQEA